MGMIDKFAELESTGTLSNAQKLQQGAKETVSTLIPYATTYTSQDNLGAYQKQQIYEAPGVQTPINKFTDFAATFGGQIAGLVGGLGGALFDTTLQAVTAPFKLIASPFEEADINRRIDANMAALESNRAKTDNLIKAYQEGKIDKDEYKKALFDLSAESSKLNKEAKDNAKSAEKNMTDTGQEAIDTALDVITVIAAVGSGGLTTVVPTLAKSTSTEAVAPVVRFFGQKHVTQNLLNVSTKIDDVVKSTAKVVNKIGTFNGRLPAGQLIRVVDTTIKEGAANLTAQQIAKNITIGLLIKRPLIYQTNVGLATDIYKEILEGDVQGTVLSTLATGAMALSGGPIGYALESIGKGTKWLKNAAYYTKSNVSRDSFFDALSTKIGNGSKSQFALAFAQRAAKGNVDDIKFGNVMADVNMKMANGDSDVAAMLIVDWYQQSAYGRKLIADGNVDKIIDDMVKYATTKEEFVQDAIKNGLSQGEAKRLVLGRANKEDKAYINKFLEKVDSQFFKANKIKEGEKLGAETFENLKKARLDMLQKVIDRDARTNAWTASDSFVSQIEDAISFSNTTKEMTKRINKIETGKMFTGKLSKGMRKKMTDNGYIPLAPKETYTPHVGVNEVEGKIKTEFTSEARAISKDGPDLFEQAVKPLPILSHITGALTKVGLSPQASQDSVNKVFQDNFDAIVKSTPELSNIVVGKTTLRSGKDIMTKLYSYVRKYNAETEHFIRPIIDIRQMTKKEIMKALRCSESQSKQVMRALNSSMLSVPRELRGLGDKIQDFNLKYNPAAAWYSRTQGTFRYTINPFFKMQQSTQTEFLAQIESGGKIFQVPGWNVLNRHLFDKEGMKRNEEVIKMLQQKNIFAQGYTGEGYTGDIFAALGSRIIKGEKISLAGLVQKQAKLAGFDDVEKYIDSHYDEVVDTLRTITIAHKGKDFFDSPLARTINTAFFPFRFNMKVAGIMAKQISQFNAPTQVALISNLMDASEWLKSDEGLAWQTQYSDAIAMFNWITPTYPLSYVAKLAKDVVDPDDAAVGDLGLLGGLPFGMISQILEANGIITASAAYVNPKTGDVYPRYAPKDIAGQVNLAVQSFIGSLFSYPGSLFGLPTKSSLVRSTTNALVGGQYNFEPISREGDLTPEQLRRQEAILKSQGIEPTKTTTKAPTLKAKSTTVKVPALKKPTPNEEVIRSKTKVTTKRKKKSEYIPRPI